MKNSMNFGKNKPGFLLFALAGILLGLVSWRCLHFHAQETVALSYDYRPGSDGFPEETLSDGWSAPVTWLASDKRYLLAGLPKGRYLFKTSVAVPEDWNLQRSPITIQTPDGNHKITCEEERNFRTGRFKKVKYRDVIDWSHTGDVSIAANAPQDVGLLSLRITNYTFYDKKLGFVIFGSTIPTDRSHLSLISGLCLTLVFGLALALFGASTSGKLQSPIQKKVLVLSLYFGPLLMIVLECLLVFFTKSRIILTPTGLVAIGILPGVAARVFMRTDWKHLPKKLRGAWPALLRSGERRQCFEPSPKKGHFIAISFIFVASLCVFSLSAQVDQAHYWCDEAIYATVVQEMVGTGNYWTPYEGGAPFFHKPPLGLFWPTVPIAKTYGINPLVVRFVPWLYSLALAILCYVVGYRFAGHFAGVASAGVLLCTRFFHFHSTTAMFETPLAFWQILTALMICRWNPLTVNKAAAIGAALGVTLMIKGAACAPLVVWLGLYLLLYRRSDWFKWKPALAVIGAFAVVGLPWHLYQYWRFNGLFWNEYWGYHVWARYSLGIEQPERRWSYYFGCLNKYAQPWYYLYPIAILVVRRWRPKNFNLLPLILFGLVVFALFSSAKTKIDQYLYPMLPVFSIAVGCALVRFWPKPLCLLFYLLPIIGVFVAQGTEDIKTSQRRRAENVEVVQYLNAHWPETIPVLCSNVFRTEIERFIDHREMRVASLKDLSGHSPLVPKVPFMIRSADMREWKEPLEKAGFTKRFGNVFAHIYSVTHEADFKPIPMDVESEPAFVDIIWHDGLQALLALKNDGTVSLCGDSSVSNVCGTVPDVNPLLPTTKMFAYKNNLMVFHQTGELSIMKAVKEQSVLRFEYQTRVDPWPDFDASAEFHGIDCELNFDNIDQSALLTGDGRVRVGTQIPTDIPRYASLGTPIYFSKAHEDESRWVVVFSQGGIGGFPAVEPGMESILRQYRGPISWETPRLTDALMLDDGRLVVLDILGTLRTMGPGKDKRLETPWVPEAWNAFCLVEKDEEKDFWMISQKGEIRSHAVTDW